MWAMEIAIYNITSLITINFGRRFLLFVASSDQNRSYNTTVPTFVSSLSVGY